MDYDTVKDILRIIKEPHVIQDPLTVVDNRIIAVTGACLIDFQIDTMATCGGTASLRTEDFDEFMHEPYGENLTISAHGDGRIETEGKLYRHGRDNILGFYNGAYQSMRTHVYLQELIVPRELKKDSRYVNILFEDDHISYYGKGRSKLFHDPIMENYDLFAHNLFGRKYFLCDYRILNNILNLFWKYQLGAPKVMIYIGDTSYNYITVESADTKYGKLNALIMGKQW